MRTKRILNITVLLLISSLAYSQHTITGTFPDLARQQVKLTGYEGFDTYLIDSVKTNDDGTFMLSYDKRDYGMGFIVSPDNKSFITLLTGEKIKLRGESIACTETIKITKGDENKLFEQYASEHPRREQALSAWDYLEKLYQRDSLFAVQEKVRNAIEEEKQRIKNEDSVFLADLPPGSYISFYLPIRKLVSSVTTIAQYRTAEIPSAIAAFRKIDYTDPRLYKSGLLGDVIESHFWLIENSGRSLDSVYIEMNISIDYLIENLVADEKKINEITEYLFKLLEQRSLVKASEYLALKILNQQSCTIDNELAAKLESYRAMKVGNTAPNFKFEGAFLAPAYKGIDAPRKLSDIKSQYILVVFGANWCPKCPEELSEITRLYSKWKNHGVEVVFVSLATEKQIFKNFASVFPFISVCDYQKWDSPVVKAYHVFATPTLYLLDCKQEILLKPRSVKQMDAWVEWYLVQGN